MSALAMKRVLLLCCTVSSASLVASDWIVSLGSCADDVASGFSSIGTPENAIIRYDTGKSSQVSGCLAAVGDSCCDAGQLVTIVPCDGSSSQQWIVNANDVYGFGPSITLRNNNDWGLVAETGGSKVWLYNVKNYHGYCSQHKNCAFQLVDGLLRNNATGQCARGAVAPSPIPTPTPSPIPPSPTPRPTPRPTPPPGEGVKFAKAFGDDMILQQAPAKAEETCCKHVCVCVCVRATPA